MEDPSRKSLGRETDRDRFVGRWGKGGMIKTGDDNGRALSHPIHTPLANRKSAKSLFDFVRLSRSPPFPPLLLSERGDDCVRMTRQRPREHIAP